LYISALSLVDNVELAHARRERVGGRYDCSDCRAGGRRCSDRARGRSASHAEASPPLSSLDPEANRPRPAAPPVEAPAGTETLPPTSFLSLIEQAAAATEKALADGSRLLEVEFPPVPLSKLEDSAISAYDLLSANLQLVLEYAQRLNRVLNASPDQSIAITLPDAAERVRATEYLGDAEPAPGVRLWALSGGDAQPSPFGFLTSLVKSSDAAVEAAPWASAYIVLGVSCAELPSIRKAKPRPSPSPPRGVKIDTRSTHETQRPRSQRGVPMPRACRRRDPPPRPPPP